MKFAQGTRIVSGIQPTGIPHLGNYLGSIKNWVKIQNELFPQTHVSEIKNNINTDGSSINSKEKPKSEGKSNKFYFFLADLHALTGKINPELLFKSSIETASCLLACGIDPKKSVLFNHSAVPAHSELMWILNCYTQVGWLNRMTQWKSKLQTQNGGKFDTSEESMDPLDSKLNLDLGLYSYPVLMAADILIYDATHVPVGEDQVQHLELTRDIAHQVNRKLKYKAFVIPDKVLTQAKRIMSLKDPKSKMSKSDKNVHSSIFLTDTPQEIRSKIMKATTDSHKGIWFDPVERPGISNLLQIYNGVSEDLSGGSEHPEGEVPPQLKGVETKEFKEMVAERVIANILPIQERLREYLADQESIQKILRKGAEEANYHANEKVKQIKKQLGLVL